MRKLRVLYAGSPLASAMVLSNLVRESAGANWEIVGVLTNPPSAKGRKSELVPTDVALAAEGVGIPVLAFDHLMADAREAAAALKADVLVSFDYGRIFGPKFLALFPLGGINLHPSALPKYRGCTPVPAAILGGDSSLGVSVQKIAQGIDEGDILSFAEIPLDGTETTLSLMDGSGEEHGKKSRVTDTGSSLLSGILRASSSGDEFSLPEAKAQSGESSYTPFLKKEDGLIDWKMSAQEIERRIRAFTPWPSCFTECGGVKLLVLRARVSEMTTADIRDVVIPGTVLPYRKNVGIEIACGDSSVLVASELQWEKKKAMDYKSFMNGARNFVGSVLG